MPSQFSCTVHPRFSEPRLSERLDYGTKINMLLFFHTDTLYMLKVL